MLAQKPQSHDSSRVPVSTVRMMYVRMEITFHKLCEGAAEVTEIKTSHMYVILLWVLLGQSTSKEHIYYSMSH